MLGKRAQHNHKWMFPATMSVHILSNHPYLHLDLPISTNHTHKFHRFATEVLALFSYVVYIFRI